MELKLANTDSSSSPSELLIVPYGIETAVAGKYQRVRPSFNRTLWN